MVAVWRGLVWIVGSLSVAVLLGQAFDTPLMTPLRPAFDAYDAALARLLAPLAPWLSDLLGAMSGLVGSGAGLYPHWTHLFVAAALHMAPRLDATFGVGGAAGGVLWCLQLAGALVLAAVLAAYAGSAPSFAVPNSQIGFVVGVFLSTAAWISAIANWQDVEIAEDERAEKLEAARRWRLIDSTISASGVLVVLAMICIGMVGLMLGLMAARTAQTLLIALVALWVIAVLIRWLALWPFEPNDPDDGFLPGGGIIAVVAWTAIATAVAALADALSLRSGASLIGFALVLAAVPIVGAYYAADAAIGRLIGRSPEASRAATPALGVFIFGGGVVLVASWIYYP